MTEDKQEFLEAVFPAYAGVNLWGNGYSVAWRGIPRVCGGEPNGGALHGSATGVFPAYAGVNLP